MNGLYILLVFTNGHYYIIFVFFSFWNLSVLFFPPSARLTDEQRDKSFLV